MSKSYGQTPLTREEVARALKVAVSGKTDTEAKEVVLGLARRVAFEAASKAETDAFDEACEANQATPETFAERAWNAAHDEALRQAVDDLQGHLTEGPDED